MLKWKFNLPDLFSGKNEISLIGDALRLENAGGTTRLTIVQNKRDVAYLELGKKVNLDKEVYHIDGVSTITKFTVNENDEG